MFSPLAFKMAAARFLILSTAFPRRTLEAQSDVFRKGCLYFSKDSLSFDAAAVVRLSMSFHKMKSKGLRMTVSRNGWHHDICFIPTYEQKIKQPVVPRTAYHISLAHLGIANQGIAAHRK